MREVADKNRQLFHEVTDGQPPLEDRRKAVKQIEDALRTTKPVFESEVSEYVHACYDCSTALSTYDMGVGDRKFQIIQQVAVTCLPYLEAVPCTAIASKSSAVLAAG